MNARAEESAQNADEADMGAEADVTTRMRTKAEEARERLEALNAEFRDLYEKLEPVVASFCPAFAAQPYHLRRYLCDVPG